MKSSNQYLSVGNISKDSGVTDGDMVIENRSKNGHSRSASNATSCYSNDTGFNEQNHIINFEDARKLCKFNKNSFWILIAISLSLLAILSFAYLPLFIKKILQTSFINLKPNGEFYDFWIQSSEPTEVGIYFFHIENPWAVENGLEKIRVREVGKYFFKQRFFREIHNFSDDMSIVNFTERRYFYFDEEKTKLSLDDKITVVNVPYAALSSLVPSLVENMAFGMLSHVSYRSINAFLESHQQHLFINITVRELLYGYRLNILDTAESYSSFLSKFGYDMMPDNKLFPNNSFGILNGRNGTPDGPYEMFTGLAGSFNDFGYFKTWNGKKKVDFWKEDSCNSINGTDGTLWPAGVNKNDRLDFFIPDICRSLYVTFQEESQYKGITTYIFSAPDEVLAGKRTNQDNECFCIEEDEDVAEERCTLDGIFDLSGCQNGVPIIVSLPHFLGADKRITDNLEGLKPDASKHRPELHIEPTMGTVIHGDSRLQMSIRVTPNENLIGFDKLKTDLYIPIFWGYKKLGMSDEVAKNLKMRLFLPVALLKYFFLFVFFGGFLFTLTSFIKLIYNLKIYNSPNDPEAKHRIYQRCSEFETMIPRVESETSDLGDSKSEDNDSFHDSMPSSIIEIERLFTSAETDI